MVFQGTRLVFHRAERRRREARHETYITPKLVTTRRSILGPPAEGRPGPSDNDDDDVEKAWALGSSNRCGAQTKLVSSLSFLRTLFLLLGGLLVKPLVHISIFPGPFSTFYQAIVANKLVPEYPLWNPLQHFGKKKLEKKMFCLTFTPA